MIHTIVTHVMMHHWSRIGQEQEQQKFLEATLKTVQQANKQLQFQEQDQEEKILLDQYQTLEQVDRSAAQVGQSAGRGNVKGSVSAAESNQVHSQLGSEFTDHHP